MGFMRLMAQLCRRTDLRLVVVALALWKSGSTVRAASVKLEWDPSPDLTVVGYILYHGVAGTSYLTATDVGNQTMGTLTNLLSGIPNVFYVTAYNSNRLESVPSNTVTTNLPGLFPPPVISAIADHKSILSHSSLGPLSFTVGDALFNPSNLTLSAVSSNPVLVPDGNILFGGSGSNRRLTVVPALNQSGSTIITVTVDDGIAKGITSFLLTVVPVVPDRFYYFLFEGESGMLVDPMKVFHDPAASKGQFTSTSETGLGSVSFPVNIPRAGAYVIWLRAQARVSDATPFTVAVDDGAMDDFQANVVASSIGWRWANVGGSTKFTISDGNGSHSRRTVVPLTAGRHKLSVRGLDRNLRLDQGVITDDRGFVPAPPVLSAPADQRIDELTTLVVTNTASVANPSATQLTFSLTSAPAGVTLDPLTGVLAWTPTEAQGPSANSIGVQVTDNGTPPLSDIRVFRVIVNEVNNGTPIILTSVGMENHTLHLVVTTEAGARYSLQASTNLAAWTSIRDFIASAAAFELLDSNAAAFPRRFYRVSRP